MAIQGLITGQAGTQPNAVKHIEFERQMLCELFRQKSTKLLVFTH